MELEGRLNCKYIFLDVDGVLHSAEEGDYGEYFTCLKPLIWLIKKIQENNYKTKIVLSSTWRLYKDKKNDVFNRIRKELNDEENKNICFDITNNKKIFTSIRENLELNDVKTENNRLIEIKEYLINNNINFGDYVIFDDNNHIFFKTSDYNHNLKRYRINYLVEDKYGNKINENYYNEYGLNVYYEILDDIERQMNKSFIYTNKNKYGIQDGFLDDDDVVQALQKIL